MTRGPTVADGLDVVETEDGIVVYQDDRERVHHLNHTAAVVLHCCDGSHDAPAIAAVLADLFHLDEPPLAEAEACLDRLRAEGLVR